MYSRWYRHFCQGVTQLFSKEKIEIFACRGIMYIYVSYLSIYGERRRSGTFMCVRCRAEIAKKNCNELRVCGKILGKI